MANYYGGRVHGAIASGINAMTNRQVMLDQNQRAQEAHEAGLADREQNQKLRTMQVEMGEMGLANMRERNQAELAVRQAMRDAFANSEAGADRESRMLSAMDSGWQKALDLGQQDMAATHYKQANDLRGTLMARAMDSADRRWQTSGKTDIGGFIDAYNRYIPDNAKVTNWSRGPDGAFKLTYERDGQATERVIPADKIEGELTQMSNPRAVRQMMLELSKKRQEAAIEAQKQGLIEREKFHAAAPGSTMVQGGRVIGQAPERNDIGNSLRTVTVKDADGGERVIAYTMGRNGQLELHTPGGSGSDAPAGIPKRDQDEIDRAISATRPPQGAVYTVEQSDRLATQLTEDRVNAQKILLNNKGRGDLPNPITGAASVQIARDVRAGTAKVIAAPSRRDPTMVQPVVVYPDGRVFYLGPAQRRQPQQGSTTAPSEEERARAALEDRAPAGSAPGLGLRDVGSGQTSGGPIRTRGSTAMQSDIQ